MLLPEINAQLDRVLSSSWQTGDSRTMLCLFAKSGLILLRPCGLQPARLLSPWDFPDKETGLDFFLQEESPSHTVQSSSFQSLRCLTLSHPMHYSTPGLHVHHQLPEFTQTHVHQVGDAIQPSHPLSSPSPPAFNISQHQGLFK